MWLLLGLIYLHTIVSMNTLICHGMRASSIYEFITLFVKPEPNFRHYAFTPDENVHREKISGSNLRMWSRKQEQSWLTLLPDLQNFPILTFTLPSAPLCKLLTKKNSLISEPTSSPVRFHPFISPHLKDPECASLTPPWLLTRNFSQIWTGPSLKNYQFLQIGHVGDS